MSIVDLKGHMSIGLKLESAKCTYIVRTFILGQSEHQALSIASPGFAIGTPLLIPALALTIHAPLPILGARSELGQHLTTTKP